MKKILIGLMSMVLILVIYIQPVRVKAVDVTYTIKAIGDTLLTTILNDVKSRRSNWFSDYKYFIYTSSTLNKTYVYLVPSTATTKIIIWKETVDSDEDLDGIYFSASCSSTTTCVRYQYSLTGTYEAVASYTTGFTDTNMTASILHYTNITQSLYYWDWNGSEYAVFSTNLNSYDDGIPAISNSVLNNVGAINSTITTGDMNIIEELQKTGNFFVDGFITLANVFINAINGLYLNLFNLLTGPMAMIIDIFDEISSMRLNFLPSGMANFLTNIASSFGSTEGGQLVGQVFNFLFSLIPATIYIITALASVIYSTFTTILSTFKDTIFSIVATVNLMLNWFPIQIASFFTFVLSLFAFSTIIRITWYVITLGAKT